MKDQFGRQIRYLRISVTDRCNLRCTYCMPEEGLPWIPKAEMLNYEEIAEIVRQMADMGLERVRITGGEPLIRHDLPRLVEMIAAVDGIDDISLSTNAILLPRFAGRLRDAGLQRVNVSLDTLDKDAFVKIARRPARRFEETLIGLRAAEDAGFSPIKINCVLMRGLNDNEVPAFAQMTRRRPWHVRFIELMPVGENLHLTDRYVSTDEALERINGVGGLEPDPGPLGNGPAVYYRFPGGRGTVGVITPMSHNYCDRCNRMRLTADGRLRTCLFGDHEVDLKGPLRESGTIEGAVLEALAGKPKQHYLQIGSASGSGGLAALSQVGG